MIPRFRNLADALNSEFFQFASKQNKTITDRLLKSTRLENAIYNEFRADQDDTLKTVEVEGLKKLSTFPALAQDVFQSLYSLNPRRNDENDLSTPARKFNSYILNDLIHGDTYPTLKSLCEGRELPAYEAAKEFIENIAEHLDELLQAAGGDKNSLNVLEKLEKQLERLKSDLKNAELDEQIIILANKTDSKARQVAALNKMVEDNLRSERSAIQVIIKTAADKAVEKARQICDSLISWGDGEGDTMGRNAVNAEILKRTRGNSKLIDIAKYLGRFREMLANLRKNAYAFGRGENYSLELGNNLQLVISSEFVLLAAPETIPLFLKKYQTRTLKQYQRRERIYKGNGDIIVCLDESGSTTGEPAAWGKALALALLEVAKINKRNFALIHFSGKNSFQTDVFPQGKSDFENLLRVAETFLGGGTNYETPLTEALRLIADGSFQNADVVFVTDGECALPEEFAEKFREEKAARNFTVTGLLLDKETPGFEFSLHPFCESVYRTSEIAESDIVRDMLGKRTV
ncbi:VWA domain-containing protein [Clostridia bacterium]|nr:VWA domain-containing protein [Clostridia bacterium]